MMKCFFRGAAALIAMASVPSWAITFETIYSFPADKSTGAYPEETLTIGSDGALYGTTREGGAEGNGVIFKVETDKTFTPLGSFQLATTGAKPNSRLLNIGDGKLYGCTYATTKGSTSGAVYQFNVETSELAPIHTFDNVSNVPLNPVALAAGSPGELLVLGASPGGVWRVPLDGGAPNVTSLFNVGLYPENFVRGQDGKLYGVSSGNSYNAGADNGRIFRVDADGTNYTSLFPFDYTTSGAAPKAAMAKDSDGVFYGVTWAGGSFGDGVFFRFDPASFNPLNPGSALAFKHLDDLPSSEGDLLLASDGKIYGTSRAYSTGFVWRINKDGSGLQVIRAFTGRNGDGAVPTGGLVQASDGFLYGTTNIGGTANNGTIFRIDLNLAAPPINHKPIATDDHVQYNGVALNVDVLANDRDTDEGDTVVVTVETQPSYGTATVLEDGRIRYEADGTYPGSDEFTYTITDSGGLSSTATVFITDEAPPAAVFYTGGYNGLLFLDSNLTGDRRTPRGQVAFSVTESGLFTGKIFTNRKTVRFRGAVVDNVAIAPVKLPNRTKAILFMVPNGADNGLSAYLLGSETWSGGAYRFAPFIFDSPKAKALYTAAFPTTPPPGEPENEHENDDLPKGIGFASINVRSNGLVSIVGKLGDGTKLAAATVVTSFIPNNDLPSESRLLDFYAAPIKDEAFAGTFFRASTGDVPAQWEGQFHWRRAKAARPTLPYPDGFAGRITQPLATRFVPPPRGEFVVSLADGEGGLVALGEGPTAQGVGFTREGNRLVPQTSYLRSFSISRASGLFSGKMFYQGKYVAFQGAMFGNLPIGFGLYLLNKETGPAAIFN